MLSTVARADEAPADDQTAVELQLTEAEYRALVGLLEWSSDPTLAGIHAALVEAS
jgi:hypothetical protein